MKGTVQGHWVNQFSSFITIVTVMDATQVSVKNM
jgi:hypothetical protein